MNPSVVNMGLNAAHSFLIDIPSILHDVIVHRLDEEFCGFLPFPHFLAREYEIAGMIFHND
jgi:hypothetical protein